MFHRPAVAPAAAGPSFFLNFVRKTLKNVLVEYGMIAVVVYLAIFFLVLLGFWFAIKAGWEPTGAMANVGAFTAAYLATKLTQPLRIIATLAVTPLIARGVERIIRRRTPPPPAVTE